MGTVLRLSDRLGGLVMKMNGHVRWGLRPADVQFLRRAGITGLPMWECARRVDNTLTHVLRLSPKPKTLLDHAAQAAVSAGHDPTRTSLPRRVARKLAQTKQEDERWLVYRA